MNELGFLCVKLIKMRLAVLLENREEIINLVGLKK